MIGLLLTQAVAAAPLVEGVISYPPAFFAAQRPANAKEMLDRLPGFTLDDGSTVRGFEGAAGNVLVDGRRPSSKSDNLEGLLERIPTTRIERIDVIRGGAPGVDMQGKSIIANIVLRKDSVMRGKVEAEGFHVPDGRNFGALKFEASGGGDRSWDVSGLYGRGFSGLYGQGVGRTGASDGRPGQRTRIDTESDGPLRQFTGAYESPLAGGRLRINGLIYNDKAKFEEDTVDVVSGAIESYDEINPNRTREIGANYTRALSARTTLELVGLRQVNGFGLVAVSTTPGGRETFDVDRTTRETIARAVLKQTWSATLSGELGAEAADNRLRSASALEADGVTIPLPGADTRVREHRAEAFAKASWRISAAWSLDGQVRYERSTIRAEGDVRLGKTLSYVKPRLLATWSPRPSTQLRLRAEREVGQLDFDSFVAEGSLNNATGVTAGNPDLEPERAWVAEAAVEQRFWGRGALVLTATHVEVQGVEDRGPVFTPTGIFDRPANIGDGSRDILRADLTLPLERLGLNGAQLKGFVTRRWSQVDDPTTLTARRISGQRPVEWEVKITQDLPRQNLTWGVELYGGYQQVLYRFNAVDSYKLDPFLMTYVEWRPRPDINIRAELENITRRGYRQTNVTYVGVRDADQAGAARLFDRNFHFGRIVYLRVRKTFGG
ncbi:MAG: TonB-dependent receptor [Phenylobacterium sp.]|uniref:TonB-dependent receptor plug domain-containing protein n=1 Tax=Phenylobacterium sp. TaxID=1871053 RepID=UPI00120A8FD0|nr:TonB-dependent receptor [Phenylobacterium sp.]TAJ74673.1 MAG: TonB-dependent receptor [Phenylobacterium sp.]